MRTIQGKVPLHKLKKFIDDVLLGHSVPPDNFRQVRFEVVHARAVDPLEVIFRVTPGTFDAIGMHGDYFPCPRVSVLFLEGVLVDHGEMFVASLIQRSIRRPPIAEDPATRLDMALDEFDEGFLVAVVNGIEDQSIGGSLDHPENPHFVTWIGVAPVELAPSSKETLVQFNFPL